MQPLKSGKKRILAAVVLLLAVCAAAGGALWWRNTAARRLAAAARATLQQAEQESDARARALETEALAGPLLAPTQQAELSLELGQVRGGRNNKYAVFSAQGFEGTAWLDRSARRAALSGWQKAAGQPLFDLELGVSDQTVALRSALLTAGCALSIRADTVYDDYNRSIFCIGGAVGGGQSGVTLWQTGLLPAALLAGGPLPKPDWEPVYPVLADCAGKIRVSEEPRMQADLADGQALCRVYRVTVEQAAWGDLAQAVWRQLETLWPDGETACPETLRELAGLVRQPAGDAVLTCYEKDGRLAGAQLTLPCAGGETLTAACLLAGGPQLLDSLSLSLRREGAAGSRCVTLVSEGDHTAAAGPYTDNTTLTLEQDGAAACIALETVRSSDGALTLTLAKTDAAGTARFSMEGTLTGQKQELTLLLQAAELTLDVQGAEQPVCVPFSGRICIRPGPGTFSTCADGETVAVLQQSRMEFLQLAGQVAAGLLQDFITGGTTYKIFDTLYSIGTG